jgi:hypothetical protein
VIEPPQVLQYQKITPACLGNRNDEECAQLCVGVLAAIPSCTLAIECDMSMSAIHASVASNTRIIGCIRWYAARVAMQCF